MRENRRTESDGPDPLGDLRAGCNMLVFAAQVIGAPLEVYLRRPGTWGERHAGGHLALGWLALLVLPVLAFPREPQGPVVLAWLVTPFLLLIHRVEGVRLRRLGRECHSRYTGDSWFTPAFTKSQTKAKASWEPVAVFLLGALILTVNVPLGAYTMVGAVCLSLTAAYQQDVDNARRRALRDARFEAHELSRDPRDEY